VNRARQHLLARPRLAHQQHPQRRGARDTPQVLQARGHVREKRSPAGRFVREIGRIEIAVRAVRELLDLAHDQEGVAQFDEVGRSDQATRHPLAVQVGAVARTRILEIPAHRHPPQACVQAR